MINHNKNQVELQKARRAWLRGSANIVERVVIQNDPSYTTMCKLINLVSGCESFSMLSPQRSNDRHLSIDMEALVADPTNQPGDVDQELVLILNQYGLNNFHGNSMQTFMNLAEGKSKLHRQLIENEDYSRMVPQIQYAPPPPAETQGQGAQGSDARPRDQPRHYQSGSSSGPRVYAPGGKSYEPPPRPKTEEPKDDQQPASNQVGASAKAHPAKARPTQAGEDPKPETPRRRPPSPPPSSRMQEEERWGSPTYADEQDATREPAQSSQQPINPGKGEKGRGKGKWQQRYGDDYWTGYGQSRGRGGKGYQRRFQGGWEYRGGNW